MNPRHCRRDCAVADAIVGICSRAAGIAGGAFIAPRYLRLCCQRVSLDDWVRRHLLPVRLETRRLVGGCLSRARRAARRRGNTAAPITQRLKGGCWVRHLVAPRDGRGCHRVGLPVVIRWPFAAFGCERRRRNHDQVHWDGDGTEPGQTS